MPSLVSFTPPIRGALRSISAVFVTSTTDMRRASSLLRRENCTDAMSCTSVVGSDVGAEVVHLLWCSCRFLRRDIGVAVVESYSCKNEKAPGTLGWSLGRLGFADQYHGFYRSAALGTRLSHAVVYYLKKTQNTSRSIRCTDKKGHRRMTARPRAKNTRITLFRIWTKVTH